MPGSLYADYKLQVGSKSGPMFGLFGFTHGWPALCSAGWVVGRKHLRDSVVNSCPLLVGDLIKYLGVVSAFSSVV